MRARANLERQPYPYSRRRAWKPDISICGLGYCKPFDFRNLLARSLQLTHLDDMALVCYRASMGLTKVLSKLETPSYRGKGGNNHSP